MAVVVLLLWRFYYAGPYYLRLFVSTLGYANETTLVAKDLSWRELTVAVVGRAFTFLVDSLLVLFLGPWPVDFVFARGGSPVQWRWSVGFRDKEIYIRRSREWYQDLKNAVENEESRNALLSFVRTATSPMFVQEKTGYLTMNAQWDLDWAAMCHATALVDRKTLAIDAFRALVLVHHPEHGWMCVDMGTGENAGEEDRRRQVFAFRDALASVGKEDLFFRWIEIIQFETSQPGGFGPEKQVEVATKVRELFRASGIDFDELWKEAVGSNELAGM